MKVHLVIVVRIAPSLQKRVPAQSKQALAKGANDSFDTTSLCKLGGLLRARTLAMTVVGGAVRIWSLAI